MPLEPQALPDDDERRALAASLSRVADHERHVRSNPLTALTRQASRTAWFAAAYRRIGPRVDPTLMRVRDGRLMAAVYGFPFLTLRTIGARSGEPRATPLLYVRDGEDVMLLGTNFGQPKHPAWTANLLAHPDAEILVGPERLRVRAELCDQETWERLFPRFAEVYPGYRNYLVRRGGLAPRMFRLRVVGLPHRG